VRELLESIVNARESLKKIAPKRQVKQVMVVVVVVVVVRGVVVGNNSMKREKTRRNNIVIRRDSLHLSSFISSFIMFPSPLTITPLLYCPGMDGVCSEEC